MKTIKLMLMFIVIAGAIAILATIAIQVIECVSDGGSYVKAFPWYYCAKP